MSYVTIVVHINIRDPEEDITCHFYCLLPVMLLLCVMCYVFHVSCFMIACYREIVKCFVTYVGHVSSERYGGARGRMVKALDLRSRSLVFDSRSAGHV